MKPENADISLHKPESVISKLLSSKNLKMFFSQVALFLHLKSFTDEYAKSHVT